MNPLITGALVGTLLLPVPLPLQPASASRVPESRVGPELVTRGADRRTEAPRPSAVWPLDPRPEVVARFDPPSTTWAAGHRGVDLLGTVGAQVRSAAAGRVTFAGKVAGRGVVVVDHGHYRTTYEPVRAVVRRGALVGTGTVLGTLQRAPSHCAPRACLHWGLVENGAYRDPLTLVQAVHVRLLPLLGQARGWARW